jgi:hypothetical protein
LILGYDDSGKKMYTALIGELQKAGFYKSASYPTRDKVDQKESEFSSNYSGASKDVAWADTLADLKEWAIKYLKKKGESPNPKKVPDNPRLNHSTGKHPHALTWVTAYDETVQKLTKWLRNCLFGQETAPFDWQTLEGNQIDSARNKAIQWVKDTFKEESGKPLSFEQEQWIANNYDAAWFQDYDRKTQAERDNELEGSALREYEKFINSVSHITPQLNDGLETFRNPDRLGCVTVQLTPPNGNVFSVKVPHGGKLAWLQKWSEYIADQTGWWTAFNAMDFVLTNLPALFDSPVVGEIKDSKSSIHVPAAQQDARFNPSSIVLTIKSPASEAEVIAEYRRILEQRKFKKGRNLSDLHAALLELYYLMPPPYTWEERLKKWQQWQINNPNKFRTFPVLTASRTMRKEWERAVNNASWQPMARKPRKARPLPTEFRKE